MLITRGRFYGTYSEAMEFFDRRLNMVTGSMNKVGSELQQKSMANQAIGKEITDKVKQLSLYNKIYQWNNSTQFIYFR